MANVSVAQKSFINDSGEPVNYKVIAITGTIDGITHTLELKANKSELLLAEILLNSTGEPAEVKNRKPSEDEIDAFLAGIDKK